MSVAATNEKLAALTAAGVSIWLDQIRRSMVTGGELTRLVAEESLRGVTSNLAIFERAILGSADYDEELAELAYEGLDARATYERIAIGDVQLACDALRGVYDETEGRDGFVSLEVSPELAHDTDATLAEARDLWQRVDRPNLMIKVPGTDAGIPAVEELLFEGLNVNVTLLFAVAQYEKVMEAYVRAMERRADDGRPLDRASVASFFVSRVDTETDKRLEALGREDLRGIAALANARAAYQAFKRVFAGERFAALRDAGCPVQRPLWASTGVKDPSYEETKYVYGLVAPDTVNTMPLATLIAAGRGGELAGATADQDPSEDLARLAEAGIDLDDVTDTLLRDGIAAFVAPMEKLLAGIDAKRRAILTGRPPDIEAHLPSELEAAIAARVRRASEEDVIRRIWHKDGTLWGPPGTPEIEDRLGWLTIPDRMTGETDRLRRFTGELLEEGFTDAVVLGMGGSSLAPQVYAQTFGEHAEGLRIHVLDSTHPAQVLAVERAVDPARTLFVLSTKSGGTIETLALFKHFHAVQGDGSHWIAVTDPGSTLLDLAEEHRFRYAFCNDAEIGGRFSALSLFGLVPAALAGIDVDAVLERADVAVQAAEDFQTADANGGLWMGLVLGELALAGRNKLTFVIDPPLKALGLWLEQLVAESTGKHGKGILPVADEPLLSPEHYGPDRVFVGLAYSREPDAGNAQALAALAEAGHPVVILHSYGPQDLGRLFFLAEFATAVVGWVLGINPFDQPDEQEAKDNIKRVLAKGAPRERSDGKLPEKLGPPSYLAILGYLAYSADVDAAVARLRRTLAERYGVATTWGYGPRYLHSTGQLHKGGPADGVFLELVDAGAEDAEVPGEAYTFRSLVDAQAAGDLATLRTHGLKTIQVKLEGDPAQAIDALAERLV
jgi:transaldolase/glucose-6-phosphate isomerase